MVVAAHPLAAEAGREMLKRGGNAIDAAVAASFTLNVVEPFASGIGGGGFMVLYLAKEKRVTVVNYREKAPAAATPTMFTEKGEAAEEWKSERGTAVGVPGMLAGWNYALSKYGTRSISDCAARAIEIAETGFAVSPTFSAINKDEYEKILKNAGENSRYLNQGVPYEPGDILRNPELAATLRLIGAQGLQVFYQGEIARKIVAAVQAKGGLLTMADLAAYSPKEVVPLEGDYKGTKIHTIPPPGSGGLHVIQLLNIAADWPLRSWGFNSPATIHHLAEAFRFIFADHDQYLGDPDFVKIPVEYLLSKTYAKTVAARIKPKAVAGAYPFTVFDRWREQKESTTHLAVVDKDGNIAAFTQSINDFFGSGIVPEGAGFLLNDHMRDFAGPGSPNAPGPGRRPVSSMGPMILIRDGEPFLVLGSPGGLRIFPTLSQIVLDILDFGMSLDEAIEAPRFFTNSANGKTRPLAVATRIPKDVLSILEKYGYEIALKEDYDKFFGGVQGLMILKDPRRIYGGADSRRDGVGAGY